MINNFANTIFRQDAIIFTTERLAVRKASVDDAPLYYQLWTDPKVMTYVGFPQGMRITESEVVERIANQTGAAHERLLVIALKATGEGIGECWLGKPNDQGAYEPDVKLLPAFWGNKYGHEVWKGLVDYLFTCTSCELIQGTPNQANAASIRMQAAAGAVRVGESVYQFPEAMRAYTTPVPYVIYQITKSTWEGKRSSKAEQG